MDESLYTRIDHADGRVEFVPKGKDEFDWVPKRSEGYYSVSMSGQVGCYLFSGYSLERDLLSYHNVYPTEAQAGKAAEYMRRSNAIIRACLLVDPDFDPDWDDRWQEKWRVKYDHLTHAWHAVECRAWCAPCYVSTKEKAEQACKLLTKWDVK